MTTENLPAIQQNNFPTMQEMSMIGTIAKHAQTSGLYAGLGGESKIFMILMAAHELSIPPLIALNGGLYIVKGKVEISARIMNSKIRQAGHLLEIETHQKKCIIKAKRTDTNEEHTEEFTWEMAERAGLVSGDNWKKYPEDMLFARCMSRIARRLFPDVISTAYVEGEVGGPVNEANLQQAQYEDITPLNRVNEQPNEANAPQNENQNVLKSTELVDGIPPIEPDNQPIEKINAVQHLEIATALVQLDKAVRENFFKYLKDRFKIDDAIDLPSAEFQTIINRLNYNISLKKQKETNEKA